MTLRKYLHWIQAALMEGMDLVGREAMMDYLMGVPEQDPPKVPIGPLLSPQAEAEEIKRRLEEWGTGPAAEQAQREMMGQ